MARGRVKGSTNLTELLRCAPTAFARDSLKHAANLLLSPAQSRWMSAQVRRARALRSARGGPFILLYHRVCEPDVDPWALSVSPRHFDEQMQVLQEQAAPVPLTYFAQFARARRCSKPTVAVTFDDGYADNFLAAMAILERHEVPATVFVISGAIDRKTELWWDELERVILVPGQLPSSLQIFIGDAAISWTSEEAIGRSAPPSDWRPGWGRTAAVNERQRLYNAIYEALQRVSYSEKARVLDELAAWAMVGSKPRLDRRLLRRDDLAALANSGLISIGAHTLTHPLLSTLPSDLQWDEISRSKAHLGAMLGRPLTAFSYPFGNYNATTIKLVQHAGFTLACHTRAGAVGHHTSRFELPRIHVEDWDGEEFHRRLLLGFPDSVS